MPLTFKTIVAAVDVDDDLAALVVDTAKDLATSYSAVLHIVDANPLFLSMDTPYAASAMEVEMEAHKADMHRRQDALEKLAKDHAPGAATHVADGGPATSIPVFAETHDADLLVIGSHQKDWWSRLIKGSESQDLVREAPCAVFVVTSAHKARMEKNKP